MAFLLSEVRVTQTASRVAFFVGVLGILGVESRLESFLMRKSAYFYGMDIFGGLAFISVAVALWGALGNKKALVLKVSLLTILFGFLSAMRSERHDSSFIESFDLLSRIMSNAKSPLEGVSLALSGFCLYIFAKFESPKRLFSNIFLAFIVYLFNCIALIDNAAGFGSFQTVQVLSSFSSTLIGVAIIALAKQNLIIDRHEVNPLLILLFFLLYGKQQVQKEIEDLGPILSKF